MSLAEKPTSPDFQQVNYLKSCISMLKELSRCQEMKWAADIKPGNGGCWNLSLLPTSKRGF